MPDMWKLNIPNPDGNDQEFELHPVGTVVMLTTNVAPPVGTWSNIGSQTIGSTTVYYFERTA